MFNFFKKTDISNPVQSPDNKLKTNYVEGEIVNGKKTSKLGLFFIIIMILTSIWQGNNLFDSIKTYIEKPLYPSFSYTNSKSIFDDFNKKLVVGFNDNSYIYSPVYYTDDYIDDKVSNAEVVVFKKLYNQDKVALDNYYKSIFEQKNKIQDINKLIRDKETQVTKGQQKVKQEQSMYNTTLLENIARKDTSAFSQDSSLKSLAALEDNLKDLNREKSNLSALKLQAEDKFKSMLYEKEAFWDDIVQKEFESQYFLYTIKVFLLSLILVLPIFIFVYSKYKIAKDQNSEYSIVWGGVTSVFAIFMLQIVIFFVTNIIPERIFKAILAWFNFGFMYTFLYWISFILIPLIFGVLAYRLQKKYYNAEAVKMRAIKSGVCPECEMKILDGSNNCPVCGFDIKVKCDNCGNMRYNFGSYCDQCGVKSL